MSENLFKYDDQWTERSHRDDSPDEGGHNWAADLREGRVHYVQGITVSARQSGFGIASLILSAVAGMIIVTAMVAAMLMALENPNMAEDDPRVLGVGCGMLFGVALSLPAGVLGLIGLFQPDRAKACAAVGLLMATVEFLGVLGIVLLGLLLA